MWCYKHIGENGGLISVVSYNQKPKFSEEQSKYWVGINNQEFVTLKREIIEAGREILPEYEDEIIGD